MFVAISDVSVELLKFPFSSLITTPEYLFNTMRKVRQGIVPHDFTLKLIKYYRLVVWFIPISYSFRRISLINSYLLLFRPFEVVNYWDN